MHRFPFIAFFLLLGGIVNAQQLQGDRWVDNNLQFQVTEDKIKQEGVFTICVIDTSRGYCIENLMTGVEVEVLDGGGQKLWKGVGSGRASTMKLPQPYPNATHVVIRAFKPWVINKSSGNKIYQDERIELKHRIK